MTDRTVEQRVLFAIAPQADGVPVLTFLMPEESWAYMQDGLGHDFDLTRLGLPLRIVIGRTETHATGMDMLRQANGGAPLKDLRSVDVGFAAGRKETKQ